MGIFSLFCTKNAVFADLCNLPIDFWLGHSWSSALEFCQDGNFNKFYAESLCNLTIDIFPVIVYNSITTEERN